MRIKSCYISVCNVAALCLACQSACGITLDWTANCLNQYTEFTHDADGNMTQCGDWTYTYDAVNRLKTASSNGVLLVTSFYDAKSRRVKKITSEATTTFFYDGWNLVEERISYTNGTTTTIRYFWGKDISGTLQGAGGVGGLLYLTVDGVPFIPCYDNIGNVTRYLDANGNTVAQYNYDAFGNILSQSGTLWDVFRHRFSTKYYDLETRLYYYGYRFYSSDWRIWLNRDPKGEDGGVNLQAFCRNNTLQRTDPLGLESYCDCFNYTISVLRRDNWTWPRFWEADYDHDDRWEDGASLMWSTASYGGFIHNNYITQVTVAVVPKSVKSEHCGCGTKYPNNLPYRPYVIIDGPLSRRVDGQVMGESAWSIIFNIAGQAGFDYWISQNVPHYQPGTRTRYKVTVTDGFDNVCGTKEFSIQY